MAKPRNWLAVHAHLRGGAGPHKTTRDRGPSADEWLDYWGHDDEDDVVWDGYPESGTVVIEDAEPRERAPFISRIADQLAAVIASEHVHARDPDEPQP